MAPSVLTQKRYDALVLIGTTVFGNGFLTMPPKPAGTEIASQIGTAVIDLLMCAKVYKVYNDKELSTEEIIEVLFKAGVIVTAAGVITYFSMRFGQGILNELTNVLGPVAWTLQGLLSASLTFSVGLAWLIIIDKMYCQSVGLAYAAE
jgi:hypothetical protein